MAIYPVKWILPKFSQGLEIIVNDR